MKATGTQPTSSLKGWIILIWDEFESEWEQDWFVGNTLHRTREHARERVCDVLIPGCRTKIVRAHFILQLPTDVRMKR